MNGDEFMRRSKLKHCDNMIIPNLFIPDRMIR